MICISTENDATCDSALSSSFPSSVTDASSSFLHVKSYPLSSYPIYAIIFLVVYLILIHIWNKISHAGGGIPNIPSYLPWIGSGIEFRKDSVGFISKYSKKLKSDIFTAHMAGRRTIFVADHLAAEVAIGGRFKVSWRLVKFKMHRNNCGESEKSASFFSHLPGINSRLQRSLMNTGKLVDMLYDFQEGLKMDIFPSLLDNCEDKKWKQLGIMDFFSQANYSMTARSLYGYNSLATQKYFDLMVQTIRVFPKMITTPTFLIPFLLNDDYEVREEWVREITKIMGNHHDRNKKGINQISDFVEDMDEFYRQKMDPKVITPTDLNRVHLMLFFAAVVNTTPTIFWTAFHLLQNRDAYDAVCKQVLSIYQNKTKSNNDANNDSSTRHFTLSELEEMTTIESLMMEAQRHSTSHQLLRTRVADADFTMKLKINGIEKKVHVKKENILVTCPTLLHMDEDVFEDPFTFKWDRFLPDDNGPPKFTKNGVVLRTPVRMFGNGPGICPGRRFAKAGIKAVIANVIIDYDIQFVDGKMQDAPAMLIKKGVASQGMPSNDVMFEIRKRGS